MRLNTIPMLLCRVAEIRYQWDKAIGELVFHPDSLPNMGAVTALFQWIDPKVREIRTYKVGGVPDTMYRRKREEWQAYTPAPTEET